MDEPSPRSSRLALAGALAAAIVIGGAGFLLGRSASEPPPAAPGPPITAPAPEPPPEPASTGILGRADLIALAARAADSTAAGGAPDPEIVQADGRRFEIRLPFGCSGPSEGSEAPMRWRYDQSAEALRITVDPTAWTSAEWWPGDPESALEAIEGFWIARPWTSSEACPAEAGPEPQPTPMPVPVPVPVPVPMPTPTPMAARTLALGQLYFADGRRGGRRDGKPFEAVVNIARDRLDASAGFRFRISGRIARERGLGPIHCRQPAGPDRPPVCLVSVVLDEVAVENPADGSTLAIWTLGAGKTPEA